MKTRIALTNLIDDIIYKLVLTNRHLTDVSDLSDSEYKVLWYLHKNPHVNMKQIAFFSSVSLPRASKIIDSLVKHDYVIRENSNDRRKINLTLTKKGSKLIDKTIKSHQQLSEDILSPLSQSERDTLYKLLNKCKSCTKSEV